MHYFFLKRLVCLVNLLCIPQLQTWVSQGKAVECCNSSVAFLAVELIYQRTHLVCCTLGAQKDDEILAAVWSGQCKWLFHT